MSANPSDAKETLSDDLCQLGEQLKADARSLEQTYPCKTNHVVAPRKPQTAKPLAHRCAQLTLVGITLVVLFVAGLVVGKLGERWSATSPPEAAAIVTQDVDAAPAHDEVAAADAATAPVDGAAAPASRFSVRELVLSADMLEERTAGDEQLSDAEKITLLEKALDRYRSVIIYLQDEIKTRDEERVEQTQHVRDLEERLRALESSTTP